MDATFKLDKINVPRFFYGTAWKKDTTADLTYKALMNGFQAVDTANQLVHYHEEGAGKGVQHFLQESGKTRGDLFLQTKFTYARGQDHRKPYDENDPYTKQVEDSFTSSLEHLQTDYVDSYLLHGPFSGKTITQEDVETWSTMEAIYEAGKVKFLGVSNFSAPLLEMWLDTFEVKPAFVQNRCFARTCWDKDVRKICADNDIVYQGFSLLTANAQELQSSELIDICQ